MLHPFMGIEQWDRVGLSVGDSTKRLHRIGFMDRQMMRVEAGHMITQALYEVKGALARMLWQDALHYDQLRSRCKQLRMSTVSFDKCPEPTLAILSEEVLNSPNLLCLFAALFQVVKPAQIRAISNYMKEVQPLVDEPTIHIIKHQLLDRVEQVRWGQEAFDLLSSKATEQERSFAEQWVVYLEALVASVGGLDGTSEQIALDKSLVVAAAPFEFPMQSMRDARFTSAVTKFKGIALEDNDAGRFKAMLYTRFFEMTAAEAVAYVHFTAEGKPWGFYYDTARHTWDEVRHSWFGEAALRSLGYDIYAVPNWTGWYDMTRNLFENDEAYTHLTIAIEKAAMKYPPGKREEWEFCRDIAKNPLMQTFQDFDWADEVVHAGFGQRWIIEELHKGDVHKALEAAKATTVKRVDFMAKQENVSQDLSDYFAGGY